MGECNECKLSKSNISNIAACDCVGKYTVNREWGMYGTVCEWELEAYDVCEYYNIIQYNIIIYYNIQYNVYCIFLYNVQKCTEMKRFQFVSLLYKYKCVLRKVKK